jgi:hypothetical protein
VPTFWRVDVDRMSCFPVSEDIGEYCDEDAGEDHCCTFIGSASFSQTLAKPSANRMMHE